MCDVTSCFDIGVYAIEYYYLLASIHWYYEYVKSDGSTGSDARTGVEESEASESTCSVYSICSICSICRDSIPNADCFFTTLKCGHRFHILCIRNHIDTNTNLCPVCRDCICETTLLDIHNPWVTNPATGRRIRIGGRTYNAIHNVRINNT
jgi:hypothetical protein